MTTLCSGHKSAVLCLSFSPDGRFLARFHSSSPSSLPLPALAFFAASKTAPSNFRRSGSSDRRVLVWDIAYGHLLAELSHHQNIIASLDFSREGTVLASSATDCTIALWDFGKLMDEAALEEVNVTHNPDVRRDSAALLLGNYRTKTTPVLHLHFTRRNLLLASGPFDG